MRAIGPLGALGNNVAKESVDSTLANLPEDGFELWEHHFSYFKMPAMVDRIRVIKEALYTFAETGLPNVPGNPQVLDHGVCGALLLLKYSTVWFRLIFACKDAAPRADSYEERVRNYLEASTKQWSYHASHWWRNILWATASVAVHNVQQTNGVAGLAPLQLGEDSLSYLGVLVDILQEWDRPSSQRDRTIKGQEYRINSADVTIGTTDGRVQLAYVCRDGTAARRQKKLITELELALVDWRKVVDIDFRDR